MGRGRSLTVVALGFAPYALPSQLPAGRYGGWPTAVFFAAATLLVAVGGVEWVRSAQIKQENATLVPPADQSIRVGNLHAPASTFAIGHGASVTTTQAEAPTVKLIRDAQLQPRGDHFVAHYTVRVVAPSY